MWQKLQRLLKTVYGSRNCVLDGVRMRVRGAGDGGRNGGGQGRDDGDWSARSRVCSDGVDGGRGEDRAEPEEIELRAAGRLVQGVVQGARDSRAPLFRAWRQEGGGW